MSFEFFPPRTEEAEESFRRAVSALAPFAPEFVSITQGAAGSGRLERTAETVRRVRQTTRLHCAPHITLAGTERAELAKEIEAYWQEGIRHIVALRGDMPDMGRYKPIEGGLPDTPAFIRMIKEVGDFEVFVSTYPEKHPESASLEADIALLARKAEAGAAAAITQFAFESSLHARFLERVRAAGIGIPIIPGIILTTNFNAIARMAGKCGASVPDWLRARHGGLDTQEARREAAVEVARAQVAALVGYGFERFHLYTLNQPKTARALCLALEEDAA